MRAPQHATSAAAATAGAAPRSAVGFSGVAISRRLPCLKPSGPSTGSRQFSTTQPPGGVPSRRGAPVSRRLAVGLQTVQSTVRPTTHDSWRQRELNAQYQLPSFLPIPPSASAIYPALCACHLALPRGPCGPLAIAVDSRARLRSRRMPLSPPSSAAPLYFFSLLHLLPPPPPLGSSLGQLPAVRYLRLTVAVLPFLRV